MMYITNKYHSIKLPCEDGMIEWLQENYPHSDYQIINDTKLVDTNTTTV